MIPHTVIRTIMPSIGLSFFILGVFGALVRADNSTSRLLNGSMSDSMTVPPSNDGNSNSSINSTTAEVTGDETTPGPISTTVQPTTPPATTSNSRGRAITKDPKQHDRSDDRIGIIILVVIIIVALGFGVACYCARKRGRRYSVDIHSRADEANIPLSNVEPEMTAEAGTQNGVSAKAAVAEAKAEEQVEKKAEADNSAAESSAESAAPAKPPGSEEVDPAIGPTPPASAELSVEELTDEGLHSNKTSVESLREANENNSNNGGPRGQRDRFRDVSLSASV